jgi:uncharacterized protein
MNQELVGRVTEIKLLSGLKNRGSSSFVAVYGRRRVGKTYLIRTFFNDTFSFHITGVANAGTRRQLSSFHSALVKEKPRGAITPMPKDWFEAFEQLGDYLASLQVEQKTIFLDELPWFDTPRSEFIQALEHFWNQWASARRDILLIVCGSAASWMINNLINNRGGLHNRVTHRIRLHPFTLNECEAFFAMKNSAFERYQLIQLYMAMGGIPFYLDQVDISKSPDQNINDLCFKPEGMLRTEFDNLFASLFKKHEKHHAVVEALAQKSIGLAREELVKLSKLPDNGNTTKVLRELEESGFIRKYRGFGKKERGMVYQLSDFYSFFYLKFIENTSPDDTNTWINRINSPEYHTWSGYAFEQICISHLSQIKHALGISGIQTVTSAWIGSHDGRKAQVDLVIDRKDQVINLCEMKFSMEPFVISKSYAEQLQQKISVFKAASQTRKAVFLTMIATFGLTKNEYSQRLVQNDFDMSILFKVLQD